MDMTKQLQSIITRSGETHYRIGKETGIDSRVIDRFMSGESDIRGSTIDKICSYFGLELCDKKSRVTKKKPQKASKK